MKILKHMIISTVLICSVVLTSFAQFEERGLPQEKKIKVGLGFEYFSRTITWDEEESTSLVNSLLFLVNMEYKLWENISMGALLGYSLSSYEEMIFKGLPFSVEVGEEYIGGYIFGGEFDIRFTEIRGFEISGIGQFVYYLGKEKIWDIPGLAVSGIVSGKPKWMRLILGPTFTYRGFDYFYPHIFLGYDGLWGKFLMDQDIELLSGSEEKKISSKGKFNLTCGATYEPSDRFEIKAEFQLIPTKNRMDYGIALGAKLLF